MKNIKSNLILLLIVGLVSLSCQKNSIDKIPEFKLEQPDLFSEEAYEIYSLAIKDRIDPFLYVEQGTIINGEKNYEDFFETMIQYNPNLDKTIIDNYVSRNESSYNLENRFEFNNGEIELIPSKMIQYIFNSSDYRKNWDKFETVYPNSYGILKFSRIGFNERFDQAIFHFISDSRDSSMGEIIYLNKIEDKWIIIYKEGWFGDKFDF